MPYDSIRVSRKRVVSGPMFIWTFWLVLMSTTYHLVYYHDLSNALYIQQSSECLPKRRSITYVRFSVKQRTDVPVLSCMVNSTIGLVSVIEVERSRVCGSAYLNQPVDVNMNRRTTILVA